MNIPSLGRHNLICRQSPLFCDWHPTSIGWHFNFPSLYWLQQGAATCPFPVHGLWYSPLCIYTHTYTYTYTCTYIYIHIHIHIDIYTVYVYSFYYLLLLKLLSSLLVLIIYVKGSIFSIYRGVLLSTALKMFATRYCAILCSSRSQGCSWGCDWTQCSVDTRPRPWHPSWEEKTPRGDDRSKIVCFWDQKNHLCMTGFL